MGRWAQRQRTGGGLSLNFMVQAILIAADTLEVHYLDVITGEPFTDQMFQTDQLDLPDSVEQTGPKVLELVFPVPIASTGTLTYDGPIPRILKPQTIAYS